MSETPRTDATQHQWTRTLELARTLERELAAERAEHEHSVRALADTYQALERVTRERDEARAEIEALQPGIDHLRETCDGLEAERDALRAELNVSEKSSAEYMAERNQARDLVRAKNAEIDALRAEVERLRAAIKGQASLLPLLPNEPADDYVRGYSLGMRDTIKAISAALQEPTP